ncbi:type IV toxin-antitoxin system AbiEi family antitoxin [Undibacterium sp. Ren11W]|uniref:type IV toxin-antitoxin system AbiEi family antitoxin n=1 Tax=Undibacterium sp. Ren11W TaxID=3413045 RepID=UPI003BF13969
MSDDQTFHTLQAELIATALSALKKNTGVTAQAAALEETNNSSHRIDAAITLQTAGQSFDYQVKCKSVVDRKSTLAHIKAQLEAIASPGLLISSYLSAEMAEHCRSIALEFIDTVGNAYLSRPGLHVFVKGQTGSNAQFNTRAERGSNNPTAMRMIFTLLCQPEAVTASYREIAAQAGIALGTVGTNFLDLSKRGFLIYAGQKSARRLLEPSQLRSEWVINYPIILRPKLKARQFRAPDPDWWKALKPDGVDMAWGGEVAAQKLINDLKPATQTLYLAKEQMAAGVHDLVKQHRLRPDPEGPIQILEKFWQFAPLATSETPPGIAPPLLVYADLLASRDPRNAEVAKMIKEKYLNHAQN